MSPNQNLNETGSERTVASPPLTFKGKIFIAAFLLVFLAAAFFILRTHSQIQQVKTKPRSNYSGTTQAKITKNNHIGYDGYFYTHNISYQYNINGKVYDESARIKDFDNLSDKFPPNKVTTFCYDPDSPRDGYLLENLDEKECGR